MKAGCCSREKSRERERTRKRLNDDLIGFVTRQTNKRKQTNFCGRIFFEFFSFFSPQMCFIFFEHERTVEKPTEREREREREDDDADFVNPDFKHDDSDDDEKNERGRSSK